jgi:hypothetical protein
MRSWRNVFCGKNAIGEKPDKTVTPEVKSGPDGILLYIEDAGAKGLLPLSSAPQLPADPASAALRTNLILHSIVVGNNCQVTSKSPTWE